MRRPLLRLGIPVHETHDIIALTLTDFSVLADGPGVVGAF